MADDNNKNDTPKLVDWDEDGNTIISEENTSDHDGVSSPKLKDFEPRSNQESSLPNETEDNQEFIDNQNIPIQEDDLSKKTALKKTALKDKILKDFNVNVSKSPIPKETSTKNTTLDNKNEKQNSSDKNEEKSYWQEGRTSFLDEDQLQMNIQQRLLQMINTCNTMAGNNNDPEKMNQAAVLLEKIISSIQEEHITQDEVEEEGELL